MSGTSDAVSSTTCPLTVPGGSVTVAGNVLGGGLAEQLDPASGRGLDVPAQEDGHAVRADELGERRPSVAVEALDAAERRDVVAVAERHGAVRSRGADGQGRLRPGERVPRHVVERVLRHRQPRTRTDRHVTQPSSFSNSDTSTSLTV